MKIDRSITTSCLLVLLVTLSTSTGCATILSGSTQLVTFTSTPDRAQIEIISKTGRVINRLTTPTAIELKRGRGYFQGAALSVRASASGFSSKEVPIPTRLNGWYFGNLAFGGLIGMLIVDPLSGAMFGFPDEVHIDLTGSEVAILHLKTTPVAPQLEAVQTPSRFQLAVSRE